MAKIFLVGAGPGDPELLTLKAVRILARAQIVLHDSLIGPQILGFAPRAEFIDVGKRCGRHATPQAEICRLLVEVGHTGQITVRLKGGDPMIFGRATEEMDALRAAGLDFEVIPGITTATAAAASLARSLTQRGIARNLHFMTGHGAEDGLPAHDWVSLARSGGTIAVYMGAKTLNGLAAHFIEAGMRTDMPAIAIENASLPTQRVHEASISSLPSVLRAAKPEGPVLLLIGLAMRARQAVTESLEAVSSQD